MTGYVEVTHEACWKIGKLGAIWIIHAGKFATRANGYEIQGMPGQPFKFKVLLKVYLTTEESNGTRKPRRAVGVDPVKRRAVSVGTKHRTAKRARAARARRV